MRFLLATALLIASFAGCISDDTEPTQAVPAELNAFGIDPVDQAGQWSYAVVDATEDGDVTGLSFELTQEMLDAAEAAGGDLFLQVTPLLPLDVGLEKYVVTAFDTGRNVVADAQSAADQAEAGAEAGADAAASKAKLLKGAMFTKLEGQREVLNGATDVTVDAGAGPVTLNLRSASAFEAGDVIALVVALETTADAAIGNVHAVKEAADEVQARLAQAAGEVQGKAAILVSVVASAQAAAPSQEDVKAIVEELARQGHGRSMQALGQAKGFVVPMFQMHVEGNVRTVLQSADVQARVEQTARSLWPFIATESYEIAISSNVAGGFGGFGGEVTGDLGRLDWALDASVHGLQAVAAESGINAGPSKVSGAFELVASGAGGTDLLFSMEGVSKDAQATLTTVGFDLGASLEVLIGQSIDPVKDVEATGLPIWMA